MHTEPVSWERLVPEAMDNAVSFQHQLLKQHLERYMFAGQFVSGKKVLDAACGSGYGTEILKKAGALSVTGLDVDQPTLVRASKLYGGAGIEFRQQDLNSFSGTDWEFDVLVSFETIEHLDRPQQYLCEINSALKRDGYFIGSVPVAPLVDIDQYHKHDFTKNSWQKLVKDCNFEVLAELPQRYCATLRELLEEHKAPNTLPGARDNQLRYYIKHPLSAITRITRLLRYGLEFDTLTLVCRKQQ
ncbi:class I SAM-dependent methyltransferase [Oligoflexia bacterium]|nr:class I SAM-dependent methyltransferase [Oligoflexia bacterium]